MNSSRLDAAQPWYRQGWPWFLIAIPATAVGAGLVTLWLALGSWDGLVVDDYYQQGKAIERTLARSVLAREMGLAADLRFDAEALELRLRATEDRALPPTVVLTIAHPTRAGQDHRLVLEGREGRFSAPMPLLSAGRWLLQLEDEAQTWRLKAAVRIPAETQVRLVATES